MAVSITHAFVSAKSDGADSTVVQPSDWNAGHSLSITGSLAADSDGGASLGTSSVGWSTVYLSSGGALNFNASDVTVTHSANTLTFAGASSYFWDNAHYLRWGGSAGAIILGADVNASTVTTATRKIGRIVSPPYTNGQVNSSVIFSDNNGTANNVYIGGQTGASTQGATYIAFCTVTALNTTGGSERLAITANGNVLVNSAAIATTATDGFLYVPSCAGTPTGTPTSYTGRIPIVVDSTNNKLYFYSGGSWRDAGP